MIHILYWIVGIAITGAALGAIYQVLGTRRDGRLHPPPGRLVDLGTHRLHLVELGQGSPTIVFEAGLMSTVLSWTELQRELADSYHVFAYDRAGLGWSEEGPTPRSAERIVEELHSLLQRAEVPPPYVLVGHSFGGLTMPLFAARHPNEIAGMVLVDPVTPAEWNPPSERDEKLARIGSKVCRRAVVLSQIGVIRFVAFLLTSGAKKVAGVLVRLISKGTPAESASVSSPWFWNLPARERAMTPIFWVQEKFCRTIASQLENLPVSAKSVGEASLSLDKPVVIISAKTTPEKRREEHKAMAQRFPRGRHLMASKSTHWIMEDEPGLVIDAVREIAQSACDASAAAVPKSIR